MSLMSLALQERGKENRETDRVAAARAKYLSDPRKVDKWLSTVMQSQLPENARVQTTKHPTRTAAVDAAFSKNDPRRGLGDQIKKVFNTALTSEKYKNTDPDKLLAAVTAVGLESRRQATYDYTRKQQSALLGGEKVKPMAGYDEWLARKQGAEDEAAGEGASLIGDAPRNMALGAGFAAAGEGIARTGTGQAVVKAIAKPLARASTKLGFEMFAKTAAEGLIKAPNPYAKIAGAALLAIPEFYAFDKTAELVKRSEWGRANEGSAKVVAADLLAGLAGVAVTHKAMKFGGKTILKKALEADKVSLAAKEQLAKFPGAANVIKAHEAEVEKVATEKAFQGMVDDEAEITANVVKGVEEQNAIAKRQAVLDSAGAELDTLNASANVGRYGANATERKAGKKAAEKAAKNLERLSEETETSFPELRVFRAQQSIDANTEQIAKVEKQLGKAVKIGDYKTVAELDKKLSGLRADSEALASEHGATLSGQKEVAFGQQITAVDKALSEATDEATIAELTKVKEGLQKRIDKEMASSLNKVSDEGVTRVEEKIAQGEEPLVAVKKVERGEAAVAKQEATTPAKEVDKAVVAQTLEDETKTAVLQNIKKAIEPTIKKGSIKAPAPTAEELDYANKLGIKGYKKMSRAKLLDSIEQYEANISKVVEKLKPLEKEAPIVFDGNNLPPFAKLKTGQITEAQYMEAMKDPRMRRAEYDLFATDGQEHILAERQKTISRLTVDEEAVTMAQTEAKAMNKEIDQAKKLAKLDDIEEPSLDDLQDMEAAMLAEDKAAQSNVDAAIEASAEPMKTAEHVKKMEAETAAFDEAVVETAGAKEGKIIRRRPKTLKTILALAGPTATAMILAQPDDANASMASAIAGGFMKVAGKELSAETKAMFEGAIEHFRPASIVEGQKVLPAKTRAIGTLPTNKGLDLTQKRLPFFMDKWMSPHIIGEFVYNKLHNPMVEIASRMTAAINDSDSGRTIIKNILMDVPGATPVQNKLARAEVIAAMKPVQEKFQEPFARLGHAKGMIGELEKEIKRVAKKAAKGTGDFAEESRVLEENLAKFKQVELEETKNLAGYDAEWEAAVKPMAAKHASTRIALAAEDSVAFDKFPWLRGMLSADEKEAVAHVKTMMQEMGGRVESAGGRAIKSEDYMHHAIHPAHNFKKIKNSLKDLAQDINGSPIYSKFHSRMLGSKQMVPELEYIMERYLPDINKRIHMTEFWKKGGWEEHANFVSSKNEAMKAFWDSVRDGFKPQESTFMNNLARDYTSFEVARLLAGSLSVPFKHLIKVSATMSQFPLSTNVRSIPKAAKSAIKIGINRNYNESYLMKRFGRKIQLTEQEQFIDSITRQGTYMESIADLNISDIPRDGIRMMLNRVNEVGSIPVRGIELFDRSMSVIAGMEMAAKQGMTPQQGLEAVMKTILQNNFLGGNQNPMWLRNPKIRAMLMFQGTPFKIAERRLLVAMKSGKSVSAATRETYKQLQELKSNIREGETLFKASLIQDALLGERDQFGVAYTKTFMKELLGLGAFVSAGYSANVDLSSHAFHLPVVEFTKSGPSLNMNPIMTEAYRTSSYKDDGDFWISQFFTNYTKGVGISNTFTRFMRLNEGDIPDRYQSANNPELAYLFAVPGKKD